MGLAIADCQLMIADWSVDENAPSYKA